MRKTALISTLIMVLGIVFTMPAFAAGKSDYKTLKYISSFSDAGTNAVRVSGRGMLGLDNPDDSMAIIYKDRVSVRNFKATMKFNKHYRGGYTEGWYGINFVTKPTWFTTRKDIISLNGIYGIALLFKIDSMDKKMLIFEVNSYTPGSGYKVLAQIQTTMANDWQSTIEIKDSVIYLDGKKTFDMTDAVDFTFKREATKGDDVFVGFGGFSEEYNEVDFTLTFDKKPAKDAIAEYEKGNSGGNDKTTVNQPTTSKQGNITTGASGKPTSAPGNSSQASTVSTGSDGGTITGSSFSPTGTSAVQTGESGVTQGEETLHTPSTSELQSSDDLPEDTGGNKLLIYSVIAVAVLALFSVGGFFLFGKTGKKEV